MIVNRNKLYFILIIACLAAYIWLYINTNHNGIINKPINVCLIKQITHLPCPSCGVTRSLILLCKGEFIAALTLNPISYLLAIIMIISPIIIVLDIILKNQILFNLYIKVETYLKKPQYAVIFTLLLIINWLWNITKGL